MSVMATAGHRQVLVEKLAATGAVRSDAVRRAFASVPREHFVPRFEQHDATGRRWIDGADPSTREEWLRGVYTDQVLVVQTRPAPDIADPAGAPTSSSSMPSVMAGMLEALDLRPGMRVLEIGTGTGYHTALLCNLVGARNVVSVELDPALVGSARAALAGLGLDPVVHAGDGRLAVPGQDRIDRIIATAAADHIPPAWITRLARGGVIVTDLRGSLAGGLVRLTRTDEEDDDVVEGSFLGVAGAFMPLRGALGSPHRDGEVWDRPLDMINPQRGLTVADPGLLAEDGLRLVVQLHLAGKRLRGFLPDDGVAWSGRAADGSWFSVDTAPRSDGLRAVVQGGPQRLWDTVETATTAWERLGRPGVGTFRVTAHDHPALQYVTVDCDPALGWPLPL